RPVGGILPCVKPVAAGHGEPVGVDRPCVGSQCARSAPGVVILQTAADVVGTPHVGGDLIELARGDVVVVIPSDAAIGAHIHAAVVAHVDYARILRIDPDCVVVGMRSGNPGPCFAAIDRDLTGVAAHENLLVVRRVNADLAEVHGPLILIAHEGPRLAAIFRTEHATGIRIGGSRRSAAATASGATSTASRPRRTGGLSCRLALGGSESSTPAGRTAIRRGAAAGTCAGADLHLRIDNARLGLVYSDRDTSVDSVLRLRPAGTV